MSLESLLSAIHDNDIAKVTKLLRGDPLLATRAVSEPKLYQDKIVHWIYAGDTPLHLAAAGHRVEIARLLLAQGADPNSSLNHRRSGPLHYGSDGCPGNPVFDEMRQVETIRCLLEAGAKINAQDKNGATPLHRAVRTRCFGAVRELIKAGADATARNHPGSTPFHLAVQNSGRGGSGNESAKIAQREIIGQFLSLGANVRMKNGKGQSVLECAKSGWIREMLGKGTR